MREQIEGNQESADPADPDVAPVLAALSDPVRLRLLTRVAAAPGGEACVCDLAAEVDAGGPTLTSELSILVAAGLLQPDQRRDGWVWFRLVPSRLARVIASLDDLLPESQDARLAS